MEAQLSPSTDNKQIFENLELFTDKGIAKKRLQPCSLGSNPNGNFLTQ